MSLFQKTDSYLGVDIGAGGIKLVELRKTKGRPQLWTYGVVHNHISIHPEALHDRTPDDIRNTAEGTRPQQAAEERASWGANDPRVSLYGDMLKELVKAAKVSSRRATASLPVSQIFHAIVTLPLVDEKELDHHVRGKVKKMLPQPIDDMQVVFQKVPDQKTKNPAFLRVLVTAAPKSLVAFYTAIFQKAGLLLEELETEAFALERSLVGLDDATVMVIDMGAERTNLFIMEQELPVTHRSINVGGQGFDQLLAKHLGVEESIAAQMKTDLSTLPKDEKMTDLFIPLLDPISKEIAYSIDLYLHQTGNEEKRIEKIILTGGAALFPPVLEYIERMFSMRVFIGDPWARVVYQQGLKPILDELGPRMAVAIGLALRNIV